MKPANVNEFNSKLKAFQFLVCWNVRKKHFYFLLWWNTAIQRQHNNSSLCDILSVQTWNISPNNCCKVASVGMTDNVNNTEPQKCKRFRVSLFWCEEQSYWHDSVTHIWVWLRCTDLLTWNYNICKGVFQFTFTIQMSEIPTSEYNWNAA